MPDVTAQPKIPAAAKKPRQGRSPAFPYVPLEKALERAEAFRIAEGGRPRHFAPLVAVGRAWGVSAQTGPALQTIAALGHFGLFEFQGSVDARETRLTDLAFRILLDKQPVSAERDEAIRQAALRPRIHAELWQRWQAALPSEATLETYLVRDRGFSETGARALIAEYKATIGFAKLAQPSDIPDEESQTLREQRDNAEIEIGDLVQVDIDGTLVLPEPARVRAVREYEGESWVFVEGSETGIRMKQVILQQKGSRDPKPPPRLPEDKQPAVTLPPVTRREVFALDEGDVTVTFPENLSSSSFDDLEGYLSLFLRKARRRAGMMEPRRKSFQIGARTFEVRAVPLTDRWQVRAFEDEVPVTVTFSVQNLQMVEKPDYDFVGDLMDRAQRDVERMLSQEAP